MFWWKLKMKICNSRFASQKWLVFMLAIVLISIIYYLSNTKLLNKAAEQSHSPLSEYPPQSGHRAIKATEMPLVSAAGNRSKFLENHPVYRNRRQLADQVCQHIKHTKVNRAVQHGPTNSAYCVTPKVGCTFWISMYRWLHGDTWNRIYKSPLDIPRYDVHDIRTLHIMKYFSFEDGNIPTFLQDRFKFMFVREPYQRLWSAYVDKFLLPDFWHVDGYNIMLHDAGVKDLRKAPLKVKKNICSNNISFRKFLEYITDKDPMELNEHYKPLYYLCSPCLFKPQLIGKMETFAQDSTNVLQLFGLDWVAKEAFSSVEFYEEHEIKHLTDFNFRELVEVPLFKQKDCINRTGLAVRLWQAFQINGYIPHNVTLPLHQGQSDITREEFLTKALSALQKNLRKTTRQMRKKQKMDAFQDAYRGIPDTLINKVRKLFDLDFKLFGYDAYPDDLYSHRGQLARGI